MPFIITLQINRQVSILFLSSIKWGDVSTALKLLLKWNLNKIHEKVKTGTLKRQHSSLRSQNVIKLRLVYIK